MKSLFFIMMLAVGMFIGDCIYFAFTGHSIVFGNSDAPKAELWVENGEVPSYLTASEWESLPVILPAYSQPAKDGTIHWEVNGQTFRLPARVTPVKLVAEPTIALIGDDGNQYPVRN